jgi:hypothetical protein
MTVFAASLFALACFAPGAQAAFGISEFSVEPHAEGGGPALLAGSHPFSITTTLGLNLAPEDPAEPGVRFTDGDLRDLRIEEPPGLIENPGALPKCSAAQFNTPRSSPFEASASGESCPANSQIGVVTVHTSFDRGSARTFGVFNLAPAPGVPAEFGFNPYGQPIVFGSQIRQAEGEFGTILSSLNFPQRLNLQRLEIVTWGVPWGVRHNGQRGNCLNEAEPGFGWAKCSVGPPLNFHPAAFLTLPASCSGPLTYTATATSWQQPGSSSAAWQSHDDEGDPTGFEGCSKLPFAPGIFARLTNPRASSPSGFEFDLTASNEALTEPAARISSQVRGAAIALPEGVTLNPSVGAGLGYCTPAQYGAETATSQPGAGCPNNSKIGDFTVRSSLFEKFLEGGIYLAQPDVAGTPPGAENPFDSLLAIYLVAKLPERGVLVKVAGRVDADPASGRLTASFDRLPQLPYTNLQVHFRESQRAPLVTPAQCGPAVTSIDLTPWLGESGQIHYGTPSNVEAGIGGAPCPAGTPPFAPGAVGGTLNSQAAAHTSFYLHLTRTDAEQEITSYSATLPRGLLGKIAGVPYCPEAAIAAARTQDGFEETAHPSCPAASEIGHTVAGYGVGAALAYAPGRLYLAGPYHGSAFSVVAIDSATVGPFDLGTVIVRSAIVVDPHTAQVAIDSAGSDPIPHILRGIPIHLRDVRVYLDHSSMMVNPTSCQFQQLVSTLNGSGAVFSNPADDSTAKAIVPFQAANCGALPFKPTLGLRLRGGTRRGSYPSLRATLTARPGDANIAAAAVTLPPSLFLAQNHIGTVCTKPQAEANACPAGSLIGRATAITPLLGAPMEGPVYLRASAHTLPDLAMVLHGQGIRIELEGRIDSSHGGLRATFEGLPDAPVTKFTVALDGGRHSLLVISARDLCTATANATARFVGQNNSGETMHPKLRARCAKGRRHRDGKSHTSEGKR